MRSNRVYLARRSYTIVGMAAMAAGGTRTLSSAVIVFEMTMSLNYMTPVMVATVIGVNVNLSVFFQYRRPISIFLFHVIL
jgi:H+/Cl- antiporter ClcA